jgi:hydroxymethylbilane synthase
MKLRIATRQSPLALVQAQYVADLLCAQQKELHIEFIKILAMGDKLLDQPLAKIGGKNLFVKELEQALLEGSADMAVHSMKDMPSILPDNLALGAICKRHNPTDSLVGKEFASLADLPAGAIVGTSSLRRTSQLLAQRPDLQIKAIRGNIHTRLAKLDMQCTAIVLASASLERLKITDYQVEQLEIDKFTPAVGQGAIGVEYNSNNHTLAKLLAKITHSETSSCVTAERAMNQVLGGNCHTPIAGYARVQDEQIMLQASVASIDGKQIIKLEEKGSVNEPTELGLRVGQKLLEQGARDLLN